MGVPRLFPWIVKNFGRHVIRLATGFRARERGVKIDNLYLDDNGLLHTAAQEVYNYGAGARKMSPYGNLSEEQLRLKCYDLFFEMTKEVVKMIDPKKRLYIAIDGPAPLAKQGQQRERRFCADVPTKVGTGGKKKFTSTHISPGTEFEFELTRYIHTKIRELMQPGGEWHHLEVIFSPPTSPGEGEHSCLDHMRKYTDQDETNCIFGPDGDLIMLALSSHRKSIFLFRQDQYCPGYYDLLDFGGIREELGSKLFPRTAKATKRSLNDVSDDFVLIGFFVGNDFLPKIQMFMYLEDGLELMISTYANISERGATNLLVADGEIVHSSFVRFVEELVRREGIYILDQHNQEPPDPRFKNETLNRCVKVREDGTKRLNLKKYRRLYYKKSGIDIPAEDDDIIPEIRQMCLDYLRMIAWVFKYYVHGLPSWHDYYPWHYAPLMGDLIEVMSSLTKSEMRYVYEFEDRGKPSLPFVQLLCILPPSSSHLLPPEYSKLMVSPTSKLVKSGMYPETFQIDYEGKTKEHMGVALLPYVDIDLVWGVYNGVVSKKKYIRNRLSKVERFVYKKTYTAKYTSKYGDIEDNHVVKSYLD
jgi:5'-3' exoribonuclease 1